jgi:hypothetical protein
MGVKYSPSDQHHFGLDPYHLYFSPIVGKFIHKLKHWSSFTWSALKFSRSTASVL